MYLIIKQQWIRNSTQNGEHVIDSCSRKREANGLTRHHFKSALQQHIKHYYDWDVYEIDEENNSITLADGDGLLFYERFYYKEVP